MPLRGRIASSMVFIASTNSAKIALLMPRFIANNPRVVVEFYVNMPPQRATPREPLVAPSINVTF